jgi:hypothetical protein
MRRIRAPWLSGIVGLVKLMMTTMRTPLSEGLFGQLGIKINKRRKKGGIGNEKM